MAEKLYKFANPQFGIIELSRPSAVVKSRRMYKKMEGIHQLGEVALYKKHANHTRAEHSDAVAYLSRFTALHLQKLHPCITDYEVLCVELAGLLHDIGHGPFSHGSDEVAKLMYGYHKNSRHENRSQVIAGYILRNAFDARHTPVPIIPEKYILLVQYLIDPTSTFSLEIKSQLPKFTPGIDQIVNNVICGIDTDKMCYIPWDAYMLRDPLMDDYDPFKIISHTKIIAGLWTFDTNDRERLINLMMERRRLHATHYQETTMTAIATAMKYAISGYCKIKNTFECFKLEGKEHWDAFSKLTDQSLLTMILGDSDPKIAEFKAIVEGICSGKNLPKYISNGDEKDEDSKYIEVEVSFGNTEPGTNIIDFIPFHNDGEPTSNPTKMKRLIQLPNFKS